MHKYARKDGLIQLAAIVGGVGVCLAVLLSAPPALAQGPQPTPTPYPAIEATRQAAQAQLDQANAQQAQAAQMDAAAAEMRRNAERQQVAANQAISDARAASVAQNAVAIGEAIGRAESNVAALSASVEGLTGLNAVANATTRLQAQTIISLTLDNQSLRVGLQTAQAVNAAQARTIEQTPTTEPSAVVPLVVGAIVIAILAILLVVVLSRKSGAEPAQVGEVYDAVDEDEAIRG